MMRVMLVLFVMNVSFVTFVDDCSAERLKCYDMLEMCAIKCATMDGASSLKVIASCGAGCNHAFEICRDHGGVICSPSEFKEGVQPLTDGRKGLVVPMTRHQWDDPSELAPQDPL